MGLKLSNLDPRFVVGLERVGKAVTTEASPSFPDLVVGVVAAQSGGNVTAWRPSDRTYGYLQLSGSRGPGAGLSVNQLLNPSIQASVGLPALVDAYNAAVENKLSGEALVRAVCKAGGYTPEPVLRELQLGAFAPKAPDAPAAAAPAGPDPAKEAEIAQLKAELDAVKAKLAAAGGA